jgi:transcriptional regulator with XRE-family HTH domain
MGPKDDVRLALRRARDRSQLDQGQFAEALGERLGRAIPRTQISDWERGRYEPGATVLVAAAELAGVTVDELLIGGGGPLTHRLENLDDAVHELQEAVKGEAGLAARLASSERESERVGALIARIIEVLEEAGHPLTVVEQSGEPERQGRERRRAGGGQPLG